MMRFLLFLFWRLVYLCRPEPASLDAWILMVDRTHWPWHKFRPYVWFNVDGRQWEIWFSDDRCTTRSGGIALAGKIHTSDDNGEIVGLTIWDARVVRPKGDLDHD